MEAEIKQIIEKNLPAQVGDVLKTRLAQAEKDAINLENEKKLREGLQKEITSLNLKIEEYKKLDERNSKLEARERAADDKERNLKVSELTYQLKSEQDAKLGIFELVRTFVSNPRSIEVMNGHKSIISSDHYDGNRSQKYPTSESVFSETEKKEVK